MKHVLMRTHQHRYFGQPGVEFPCPDEVAEELVRLDKRMFHVGEEISKPAAEKLIGKVMGAEAKAVKAAEELEAKLAEQAEERRKAEEGIFDEPEEEKAPEGPPADKMVKGEQARKK
jgi:hypothetical protein